MPSQRDRGRSEPPYYYRRELGAAELVRPVALGAGIGLAVFYLARVLAQRTPLTDGEERESSRSAGGDRPVTPRRA